MFSNLTKASWAVGVALIGISVFKLCKINLEARYGLGSRIDLGTVHLVGEDQSTLGTAQPIDSLCLKEIVGMVCRKDDKVSAPFAVQKLQDRVTDLFNDREPGDVLNP